MKSIEFTIVELLSLRYTSKRSQRKNKEQSFLECPEMEHCTKQSGLICSICQVVALFQSKCVCPGQNCARSIGDGIFRNCALKKVVWAALVRNRIAGLSFYGCQNFVFTEEEGYIKQKRKKRKIYIPQNLNVYYMTISRLVPQRSDFFFSYCFSSWYWIRSKKDGDCYETFVKSSMMILVMRIMDVLSVNSCISEQLKDRRFLA